MTILDNSKLLMYDFFYNELKNNTAQGASSCTQIRTAFCLKSKLMTSTKTSNQTKLPEGASTPLKREQKVLGKMKGMCRNPHGGVCVSETENVLYLEGGRKNIKKAKGVKKSVVKKQIMHEQYKETLFGTEQLWHGMNILLSKGHEIYGMHQNKISRSLFD